MRQPGALTDIVGGEADVRRPAPTVNQHDHLNALPPPSATPSGEVPRGTPLDGITVLELAVMFAAPYGATLLSDLGARVIKVEPIAGDPIRSIMPFPETGGAKVMQGKESICVDITTPEGLDIVHKLATKADLVLDGFRSGAADRLGLGAEALHVLNPQLVYVSASGYGRGGPDGHRPAFAPSIGAASGITRANLGDTVQETPGLSPAEIRDGAIRLFSGSAVVSAQADGFAALGVATSLLLGLLARERTGAGQYVSSSMLATATHAIAEDVVDVAGPPPTVGPGADMRGPTALYRIYDTNDGWVFLAAPAASDWNDLAAAMKPFADLATDERFASPKLRAENDAALADILQQVFKTRSKETWEQDMVAADVGCVAVTTERIERVLQSDKVGRASGYIVDVTHPTFEAHPRLAPLVRFSRSTTQANPGVLAGSSTDRVLAELGYDTTAIASLRARSIVAVVTHVNRSANEPG